MKSAKNVMSDYEIYQSWKTAKKQNYQIDILAQLNNMSKEQIKEVIKAQQSRWKDTDQEYQRLSKKHRESNKNTGYTQTPPGYHYYFA